MATAAIAGLGLTELGKVYGRTPRQLAAEAVRLAVADAGLEPGDLDGLLICPGIADGVLDVGLARTLGLRDLRLLSVINAYGASAGRRSDSRRSLSSAARPARWPACSPTRRCGPERRPARRSACRPSAGR